MGTERISTDKSASVYLSLAGVGFPRCRLRPNSDRGELKFQARGARQLMPGLKLFDRSLVRELYNAGVGRTGAGLGRDRA